MSIATLEKEIRQKAEKIAGKKLRAKDLMEWRVGKGIEPRDDEDIYFIEDMNTEVAFKKELKKEKEKN